MTDLAIVVGSTRNIGRAIAEGLAKDGYHVVVTSRDADDAHAVAESLPGPGTGVAVDVTEPASIDALFATVDGLDGRLAALVNNVARTDNESILECDLETWVETMQTNLRSYFLTTKAAAERMAETGGGAVVNVTVSLRGGLQNKFSYLVSKGGVDALTKCAALDLIEDGIRVNAVGSGLVGTPVGYRELGDRTPENDRIPAGRIGDPAEVADAVRFLVSERADYVVGGMLPVDGGFETAW